LFKLETHSNLKKIMYVFKVNDDNSITGLSIDRDLFKMKSSSYYPELLEMHAFIPKSFALIKYSQPSIDLSSIFIKYGWDHEVKYGDGGYCYLKYPIYRIQELPIINEKLNFLVDSLRTLGKQRKDFHRDAPVIDIIDPDLNPNYFYSQSAISKISERSRYAWFPVDVLLKQDGSVKPLGEIHNLPKKGNEQLYQCIFEVFQEMIPGFKNLNIFEEGKDQIIQVVVKAQAYLIKPKTAYSGKWHVEGKTENIVAGGVYYCKIDPELEEDYLSFHPREAPDTYYSESSGTVGQMDVPVNEGAAIVFANTIPHRFCKLENHLNQNILRLFMNFFIVDPKKRLETNQLRMDSFMALRKASKLPVVVIDEILSFVFSRLNSNEAVKRREAARQAMKSEESGWGYIHYGNSGDVIFIDDQNRDKRRYEEIRVLNKSPK
jgi:hypothetical protein